MQELITYQTYPSLEDANAVAAQLRLAGIETEVKQRTQRLGAVFIGSDYNDQFELWIAAAEFAKANELLIASAHDAISEVDASHPLFRLSNQELTDIVAKPDEWGPENFNIALALLAKRGITYTDTQLHDLREKRIVHLSQGKTYDPYWLVLGYLCSIAHLCSLAIKYLVKLNTNYSWYFPGVFGLIIGFVLIKATTTLPDGKRVPTFNQATRKHGVAIFFLNILGWIINICLLFVYMGAA